MKGGETCLDGELARACARKSGPRVEEVAAMERWKAFRGLWFPKAGIMLRVTVTKARLSALRLPSKRGDQLKAQLARRRGNVGAWLFEM